jgi:hypothetical protein
MKKMMLMAVMAMALFGVNFLFVHQAVAEGLFTPQEQKGLETGAVEGVLNSKTKTRVMNATTIGKQGSVTGKDVDVGVVDVKKSANKGTTVGNVTTVDGSVTAGRDARVGKVITNDSTGSSVGNVTKVDGSVTAGNNADVGVVEIQNGKGETAVINSTTVNGTVKATNGNAKVGVVTVGK